MFLPSLGTLISTLLHCSVSWYLNLVTLEPWYYFLAAPIIHISLWNMKIQMACIWEVIHRCMAQTGPCGKQTCQAALSQHVSQFLVLSHWDEKLLQSNRVSSEEWGSLHGTQWYWHILGFLWYALFSLLYLDHSYFFSLKVSSSWAQFLTLVPFSEINLGILSLYSLHKGCMFQTEQSSKCMIIFSLSFYIVYFLREKVDLFISLYT